MIGDMEVENFSRPLQIPKTACPYRAQASQQNQVFKHFWKVRNVGADYTSSWTII